MELDVFVILELLLFSVRSCKYNYPTTGQQVTI